MRLIVHDGKEVINVVEVEADWSGKPDEWQPEKGQSAHAHETAQIGWPVDKDGKPVTPPAPAVDLEAAHRFARQVIISRTDQVTAPFLALYPAAQIAGNARREAEARAILTASDKSAAIARTVIIKQLAKDAGETTDKTVARAQKIIAKADRLALVSAEVERISKAIEAKVSAAKTQKEINKALADLETQLNALKQRHNL